MTPSQPEDKPPLDERKFAQDVAARTRELDIKEREVAAKERELEQSRWLNPTVLGLFAAAAGLIGNVVVARVNNSNTQSVELARSQSNLVLEAIKTGDSDAACKNLMFFVGLGLLDDSSKTIRNQCGSSSQGAPSLPVSQLTNAQNPFMHGMAITVTDESGKPVEGASVELSVQATGDREPVPMARPRNATDISGKLFFYYAIAIENLGAMSLRISKEGYKDERVLVHPMDTPTIVLKRP
jgi:hypothetical protein